MSELPKFSEIITRIEGAIGSAYTGGAIAWADENHDNAWSNAITRFERALVEYGKTGLTEPVDREGKIYLETCLKLVDAYNTHRQANAALNFLGYLEERGDLSDQIHDTPDTNALAFGEDL